MSQAVDRRIAKLLDAAEAEGSCLVPTVEKDRRALRVRLRRGEIIEPCSGIFARPDYWASLKPLPRAAHVMRALARLHPAWVFCGPSAGLAWGLWVSYEQVGRVHVAGRSRGGDRGRLTPWLCRHDVPTDEAAEVGGVRATSLWRTVFDCMRVSDFRRALAVADSALKLTGLSSRQLTERLGGEFRWHPDIRRVLDVCAFADARSDNGGESVARASMISQGFDVPSLQVRVADQRAGRERRIDFVWMGEREGLGFGELDGGCKYVDEDMTGGRDVLSVVFDERRRESAVSVFHPSWVRFSYDDVLNVRKFVGLLSYFGIARGPAPARPHGVPHRAGGPSGYVVVDEELYWFDGTAVLATTMRNTDEDAVRASRVTREDLDGFLAARSSSLRSEEGFVSKK